ncbi:hypothetical protein [Ruania albidiflava]|uniref:hypothetical protein n=1 Tax=Ruania albidiflava TaxID=366586 RepID=UPI000409D889|nr:hypothetical protein [Ruania albidiflava]
MSAVPGRLTAPGAATSWRPRLRIVRAPAAGRGRAGFILLCVSILVGALLAVLMLNTAMATTAYEIHDQQVRLARLSETEQALEQEVERLSSPVLLQQRADELGMERADGMRYLVLSDQRVLGGDVPLVGED